MSIEVMKQALEALEGCASREGVWDAITALRHAIEQAEASEPVAKVVLTKTLRLPCLQWLDLSRQFDMEDEQLLYTHTPTAQAQPLTDAELDALYDKIAKYQEYGAAVSGWYDFARAIEAAHGIKGASL
jgi:hypothetical protein